MKEVLVGGAGPTGLSLALFLHHQGVPFRIFDQKKGPSTHSKALAWWPRTLELLRPFGVTETLLDKGNCIEGIRWHYQSEELATITFDLVESIYHCCLLLPQSSMEQILLEALKELGVFVEWGSTLVALDKTATLLKKNNEQEKVEFSYFVGADGSKSFVRHAMGASFPKVPYEDAFALCDAKLEGFDEPNHLGGFISKEGLLLFFPLPGGTYRILYDRNSLRRDPTKEEMETVIKERTGRKIGLKEIEWISSFGIYHSIADQFYKDNIFLAGDAAHVHSPAGGQGANTGIQDAYNLAWKLGLVYQGKADPSLLTTYQEERQLIAKQVIALSDELTKGLTSISENKYLPEPLVKAGLKLFMGNLLGSQNVKKKITNKLAQIALSYHGLSTSKESNSKGIFTLDNLERTGDFLHVEELVPLLDPKKFTLFIFAKNGSQEALGGGKEFQERCDFVDVHYIKEEKLFDEMGVSEEALFLVRPDRYIGFCADAYVFDEVIGYLEGLGLRVKPSMAT